MVEDVMQASLPSFIDSVKLSDIGQGTNPVRIVAMRGLPDQVRFLSSSSSSSWSLITRFIHLTLVSLSLTLVPLTSTWGLSIYPFIYRSRATKNTRAKNGSTKVNRLSSRPSSRNRRSRIIRRTRACRIRVGIMSCVPPFFLLPFVFLLPLGTLRRRVGGRG